MSVAVDAPRQSSDPSHRFPVRKVDFAPTFDHLEKGYMANGDVVLSHMLAALSGLFPDGEAMFVESVRHYRDQITDPDLRLQVNAFIGQEATHGREHRNLNARLAALGYRSQLVERTFGDPDAMGPVAKRVIRLLERAGVITPAGERADGDGPLTGGPSPIHLLALTAALEHYTATLAEMLLSEPLAQSYFTDDELFRMWAWHAMEECEHKSVAFDVYKAVGGDEKTRVKAMREARLALTLITIYHVGLGVAKDPATYRRGGILTSIGRLWRNPLTTKKVWRQLHDYFRADFHPRQHDTQALEAAWRAWFDEGGPRPDAAA